MRSTKSHRNNRRSHHALKEKTLLTCDNCQTEKLPHRACGECGFYKGREVVNMAKTAGAKSVPAQSTDKDSTDNKKQDTIESAEQAKK